MASSFTVTTINAPKPNLYDVEVSWEFHGVRVSLRRGSWPKHQADVVADIATNFLLDAAKHVEALDDVHVNRSLDAAVSSLRHSISLLGPSLQIPDSVMAWVRDNNELR